MLFVVYSLSALLGAGAATKVEMKNAKSESVGTVTLTQLLNGVKMDVDLHGLTPGEHAFHVHANGSCQAPKFDSAGPHFAPAKNPHGFDSANGPHSGDMPNLFVGADGRVKAQIINANVSLATGQPNSLFKPGGTALVVHEKADDYKSQPAGNAGARQACGEIR